MIGTYGTIVFECSDQVIRTYDEMETTKSPDWGVSKIIASKPRPQFNGPGQDTIKFSMKFDIRTVNPEDELSKLTEAAEKGTVAPLILGGKPYGSRNAQWYVSGLTIQEPIRDQRGKLILAIVQVSLGEYH